MEENKDDLIYDLDQAESAEEQVMEGGHSDRRPEGPVTSTVCGNSDESEGDQETVPGPTPEPTAETDAALAPEGALQVAPDGAAVRMTALHDPDPAKAELERMVEEMGAETLLDIIRDNRNAAIRQIISEVEASRERTIPSGSSASAACTSIFDLAALA